MKKISILLIAICTMIIAGCGDDTSTQFLPETPNQIITIYAIGDSITAGYQLPIQQSRPSQLQGILQSKGYTNYVVVNDGISGDTSKDVKDRIDGLLTGAKKGDIAILTIGGNDSFQSVGLDAMEQNIRDIIDILQAKGMRVVIGGMRIFSNKGGSYISDFRAVYPRVAKDTHSILIPFILEGVALKGELNLPDMIHPNEQGYTIMANTVLTTLETKKMLVK